MDRTNHLSRAKTADFLGLSIRTLDRLRVSGGGPSFWKGGSRVLYDQRDLDLWIESRKQKSTSDIPG
ncbi:MAG: helix-turn-helix domain-containing protein [Alphaproteobacteria bacterium]|nr:helix-turn-helix domain-containing protein [Rhodospirillales bacterium]MCW9045322.1 helix-turn-helix domain-containing protein [Alphaproteobacteria bacterium]